MFSPRPILRHYAGSTQIQEAISGFSVLIEALSAPGAYRVSCHWSGAEKSLPTAFGVEVRAEEWSREGYVVIPGSVYQGNRFRVNASLYPCLLDQPEDWRPDVPNTISDVPRLELEEGPSRVQQLSSDAAKPAVAFGIGKAGAVLAAEPMTEIGQALLEFEESEDRSVGWARILMPGVREGKRYLNGPQWIESTDQGHEFEPGEARSFDFTLAQAEDGSPVSLFRTLSSLSWRYGVSEITPQIPLSHAFRLTEENHNLLHWDEEGGYYACGDRSQPYAHWQMGWVGGGMSAYALHAAGARLTRERAERNLGFAVGRGQAPSGCFWSFANPDTVFGDMIDMEYGEDWHLVRRSGDGLYFLSRLASRMGTLEGEVREGLIKNARFLQDVWQRHEQFGQFISDKNGDVLVGGTCSGGIVPAGLAAASRIFDEPDLLETTIVSARSMAHKALNEGYTSGGPGEAAQCPDSESVFGLLESLVVLYEVTGEQEWLGLAEDVGYQAASWVMDSDFDFPADSTFGRLGMKTTGSVWANSQNKHSAPGICTLSGVSLLKLYRATGNEWWLKLLRDIARGLPQYLSRDDQPVFGMPSGQMCERVNTCDWESPGFGVGEGFPFGCWCEVSLLLTYAEVPGIYMRLEDGRLWSFDHVEATAHRTEEGWRLEVTNPTKFPASVRILAETDLQRQKALLWEPLQNALTLEVAPGATTSILLPTP